MADGKIGKEVAELLRDLKGARLTEAEAAELRGAEEMVRVGMASEALASLRALKAGMRGAARAGGATRGGAAVERAEREAAEVPSAREAAEAEKEVAELEKSATRQPWYQPLTRAASQIQAQHPTLTWILMGILRGMWKLKGPYLKIAGVSMFAAFIFEEALQAFGFSLSMGIRGDRDKMADPEASTEAEYNAWVKEQLEMIKLFEACIDAADWWVTYPGATALWFIRPYAHYVAAARLQAASMRLLLQTVDDERKHLTGRGATKRASDAGFAVDRAFDGLVGLSMAVGNALKSAPGREPDLGAARGALADMETSLKSAIEIFKAARPYMNRPQDKWVILSFDKATSDYTSAIASFNRQIERIEKGETTGGETDLEAAARAAGLTPAGQ